MRWQDFTLSFRVLIFNRRFGLGVMAVVMLISAALFQYPPEMDRPPLLDYLSAYNLHFLVGIGAFYLVRPWTALDHYERLGGRLWIMRWSVCKAFGPEAWGVEFVAFPFLYAVPFGGIAGGRDCLRAGDRAEPLSLPVLTLLGNASYSIYLDGTG